MSRFWIGLGGLVIGFRGFLTISCSGGFERFEGLEVASNGIDCSSGGLIFCRFDGGMSLVVMLSLEAEFRIFSGLNGFDSMTELRCFSFRDMRA